jgi:hypothetical protein
MQNSLEDLARVDWKNIYTAHGTAEHVPDAIMGLLSSDPNQRDRCYWKLENYVVLQSDLHEAAYYVIPYLIAILRKNPQYGACEVYELLREIGNGYASTKTTCRTFDGRTMPLMKACHEEVRKGLDVYRRDAASTSDDAVKTRALALLEVL